MRVSSCENCSVYSRPNDATLNSDGTVMKDGERKRKRLSDWKERERAGWVVCR